VVSLAIQITLESFPSSFSEESSGLTTERPAPFLEENGEFMKELQFAAKSSTRGIDRGTCGDEL
jgi:hypothetical protein